MKSLRLLSVLGVAAGLAALAASPLAAQQASTQAAAAQQPSVSPPAQTVDLGSFELEPLTVTAPRDKIQNQIAIDPQINQILLRLLQSRMNARPDSQAALDASLGNLARISTLTGYQLKTRYTQLGFLLTEGLAGVTDMELSSALEAAAQRGTNTQMRAAAMTALAYTHDLRYLSLFQNATNDHNITARFGALESMLIMNNPSMQFQVANMARMDLSLPVQIYAAAGQWRMGDIFGRETLLRLAQNTDWLVRAMSIHYLGEMGGADEYRQILLWLAFEQHPMVRTEMCAALLKLQRFAQ